MNFMFKTKAYIFMYTKTWIYYYLFIFINIFIFIRFGYEFYFGIIFLCFLVYEGVLGLSILVCLIRSRGNDYLNSFRLILC